MSTAVPADFTLTLKDTKAKESTDAVFTCTTNDDELPVQWLINGKPFKPSNKYLVDSDEFTHTLTIRDLKPEDDCEVTVVIGDNSSSAKLAVQSKLFCFFKQKMISIYYTRAVVIINTLMHYIHIHSPA